MEVTMHRVSTEQVDTLKDIIGRVLTGDDGADAKGIATASHLRHFAAKDTADTTETVKDNILHLVAARDGVDDVMEFVAHESRDVVVILFFLVRPLRIEATEVDTGGSQVLGKKGLGDEQRVLHTDGLAQDSLGAEVLVQDLTRATVD